MPGDVSVSGGKLRTPVGSAPILPLIAFGIGAYLLWFGVRYWRGTGELVWPSTPVKSVLQGKGLPSNRAATTATAELTAYEATLAPQGGSSSGPGGHVPSIQPNASEQLIIRAVLAGLGAPQNAANVDSIAAWIQHETPWPPVAKYNPMNTTLPEAGASDYNSVGVKNYTSWGQGVAATVATLLGGYPSIVAALRSGNGLCGNAAVSADLLKWSGGGYSSVC